MRRLIGFGILLTGMLLSADLASASALRIALNEDPDALDPASGVSFAGRVVFASLCDKLVDIDAKLNYVPQLATEWAWSADNLTLTMKLRPGVVFQDGEAFDAEAVKANIERYQNAPFSKRKTELKQVKSVEVVDPLTVAFHLSEPSAPLVGVLSDRAGMMVAPKAAAAAGDKYSNDPVCSGPYKFKSRVAQEKITVEKFDGYWNKDAIHIDEIEFFPVPDTSVRLANLRAGGFDIIERVAPTDMAAIAADKNLKLVVSPATLYYQLSISLAGPQATTPLAQNAGVREALEAAIDRKVGEGEAAPQGSRRRACGLHAHRRQQPPRAAGGAGHPVHDRRGRLRHEDPGRRGEHAHRRDPERRLPGRPHLLEWPARSRRQHYDLAAMRRRAQLEQVLQPEGRCRPRPGAPGDRSPRAAQILQGSREPLPGRPRLRLPLSHQVDLGHDGAAGGIHAGPRRADPAARDEAAALSRVGKPIGSAAGLDGGRILGAEVSVHPKARP